MQITTHIAFHYGNLKLYNHPPSTKLLRQRFCLPLVSLRTRRSPVVRKMFFSMAFTLTNTLIILASLMLVVISKGILEERRKRRNIEKNVSENGESGLIEPPSPRKLPIIGHLHLLGGYEVPYQAFSALGEKFGKIVKLQLGGVKCIVVNGEKNVREALVTKGSHFDSRPNFERYQQLFDGNKENCKWLLFMLI